MNNATLVLAVFSFVCFVIAAVWNPPDPNPNRHRLLAAGLAFFVAIFIFGSGVSLFK